MIESEDFMKQRINNRILWLMAVWFITAAGLYGYGQTEENLTDGVAVVKKDSDMEETMMTNTSNLKTAVFAGGCFWGMEGVFESLKGVGDVVSGYSGGDGDTATYNQVSTGKTGHAESVQIRFDPRVISFETLLDVFFTVAHEPTQLNYQGPDRGTQYRSAVFYTDESQKEATLQYIENLNSKKILNSKVVTRVVPLKAFYPAEEYHQDFMKKNPNQAYIVYWDLPKMEELKSKFPDLVKMN